MSERPVIVVRAAVAGAALANALGQQGVPTLVLEKGAERANSTRGDILHPPTLEFLNRWEVLEALFADGAQPYTHMAVSHRDLGRLGTWPLTPRGEGLTSRSIAVPHDRIETVMLDCARRWPSVTVERARVTGLLRQADGRARGVRVQAGGAEREVEGALVVGCDGGPSLVRRELGLAVDARPYDHELLYIAARGVTDPPAAMHFHLDDQGVVMVASRPGERMRIVVCFKLGSRGDLLRRPDPALHEYVAARVPALAAASFGRDNAYIYAVTRQLASSFVASGVALVGDAAHTTHPAGATGMNLAITGAASLADRIGPLLRAGADDLVLDRALADYDADRRPAAASAIEQNHRQAVRIWESDLFRDPPAYARTIDPSFSWGVAGRAGARTRRRSRGRRLPVGPEGGIAALPLCRAPVGEPTPSLSSARLRGVPF
jgi:2-polyprenyl-6-methoxyphenol hydroxylase-like FAD-dependent oxidoreductase